MINAAQSIDAMLDEVAGALGPEVALRDGGFGEWIKVGFPLLHVNVSTRRPFVRGSYGGLALSAGLGRSTRDQSVPVRAGQTPVTTNPRGRTAHGGARRRARRPVCRLDRSRR